MLAKEKKFGTKSIRYQMKHAFSTKLSDSARLNPLSITIVIPTFLGFNGLTGKSIIFNNNLIQI